MTALVDVGVVEDFEEGVPAIVRVGRRELAIVRWGDDMFAVRNICPHQNQSFGGGITVGRLERGDTPGRFEIAQDRPVILCPWHRWQFELDSGKCTALKRARVRTYPVTIEDGRVLVDVQSARGPDPS